MGATFRPEGEKPARPRFTPFEPIAEDDVSIAYRARDEFLGREIVLVRIRPGETAGNEAAKRLLREARALSRVHSPFVIGIHEFGEDGRGPFLCLEAIHGESLASRLEKVGKLPMDAVIRLGSEVAEGLAAVHREHLVHGNVCLGQIYLDSRDGARLAGFGLARRADGLTSALTIGQSRDLRAGSSRFGRGYAPETSVDRPADSCSDQFALGFVLLQCLAGTKRVDGHEWTPDSIRRVAPGLPSDLIEVLATMLAPDPHDRFASVADVAAALRRLAGASPAGASGSTRRPRRSVANMALAAVLLGGVASVALWQLPGDRLADEDGGRGGRLAEPSQAALYSPGYRTSHALLIGIDDYGHDAWPDLGHAVADAEAVRTHLVEREDYPAENVVLLRNAEASLGAIRSELFDRFGDEERVGANDRILVFFAGHGSQTAVAGDSLGDQAGFLVPADGTNARSSWISHRDLLEACKFIHAKHVLFLLDCCYAGNMTQLRGGATDPALYEDLTTASFRAVIAAGKPEQRVGDAIGDSGHSPFTHNLLLILGAVADDPTCGAICATDLFSALRGRVTQATGHQLPTMIVLGGHGDFFFGTPGISRR